MRCLVLVFIVACVSSDALPPAGPLGSLTVQLTGAAVGYVDSDPPGIMCGSKCSAVFPGGTMVTLFPTIGQDGAFTGWSGACSGKESCTVMIDGDQTVSAMFPCTGKKVFNYVGGAEAIQRFSAPACARHVIIEADGGQGGNAGGLGAQIRGTFAITTMASRDLTVLVGGVGRADVVGVGGGGGGSFVYLDATDALPLIAAGGGGGTSTGCSGGPGSATQTPTMASGGTGSAPGGSNGGGGSGGTSTRGSADFGSGTGGGGAGWLSNGRTGTFGSKGDGGDAPRNGGSGGGPINSSVSGGFGGGGEAAGRASGGGGGFNGGGGGNDFVLAALGCGGGGGSYNGGEDPVNSAGLWVGYGRVTIIWTE